MEQHVDDDKMLRSRNDLSELLRRPPWLRAIGIGVSSDGKPCLVVRVRTLTSAVLDLIPPQMNGIPVHVTEIGDVTAPVAGDGPTRVATNLGRRDRPIDVPIGRHVLAVLVVGSVLLSVLLSEALARHHTRAGLAAVAIFAYVYLVRAYERALIGWFRAASK